MNAIINLETAEYRIPGVLDELPELLPSDIIERGRFLRRHDHAELRQRVQARHAAALAAAERWTTMAAEMNETGDPDEPCDVSAVRYAIDNAQTLRAEVAKLDELLTPPAEPK
ncbi:hypothetical protein [Tsukamurella ocularis]|uniref:hypothetical protein n=1 Tax=Tsukamurella ocularis TaxID=1970234 RepID=UPI0021687A40|nr:hypothetical protein [Tsukamurella ocularis]MCS3853268.1 hypothetical protein [Tsukamurella ocularis]